MTELSQRLGGAPALAWRSLARTGAEAVVNFAAPFAIYSLTKAQLGDVHALMAASSPPVIWSILEFARNRRVDAVSVIVLAGIALSLLAVLGGGSARFLQLREALVAGLVGVGFLASAAIGKPLIYFLARARARRRSSAAAADFEALREAARFRSTMMILTLGWGFGLVAATAVSAALVFAVSIKTYLLLGPLVSYGAIGAMMAWTFWFARRRLPATSPLG
jgi:hypothetical protein